MNEEMKKGEAAAVTAAQQPEQEVADVVTKEEQAGCAADEGKCCGHGEGREKDGQCRRGDAQNREERHCRHEKMKAELEAAKAEAADYKDKWMRAVAEFDNFRKRNETARSAAYSDGKADVLVKILPVGDNLERALLSCDEQTKKGIEMVLRSFKKLLDDEGIETIDPKDEEFDPTFCEAIMSEPAADGVEPGYVKEVFLKGYKKGDKVIRYAQVKVTT